MTDTTTGVLIMSKNNNPYCLIESSGRWVRVVIEKDAKGADRNVVKVAVEPDHADYAKLRGVAAKANTGGGNSGAPAQAAPVYQAPAAAPQRAPVTGKPSWAQ